MSAAARLLRMLVLVLLGIGSVVPGGIGFKVCLCSDAPTPTGTGDRCGMVCCEVSHPRGPEAPSLKQTPHSDCNQCLSLTTGERENSSQVAASAEVPHVAALAFAPPAVLIPQTVFAPTHFRAPDTRGPPGRFASVPLRI